MWFSVKKVFHELALDSESDDKPSNFDSLDFGLNSDRNVKSDVDIVLTHALTSTGWHLNPNDCLYYYSPFKDGG